MDPEQTQPSLLIRVRDADDHDAWREFETKYRELVVRYCRRRGLQAADAEDVRQTVMIDLARGLRTFRYDPQRGKFRHYLCRVVRHAIARHVSRTSPDAVGLDSALLATVPADGTAADNDPGWEEEWVRHHYRLALEALRHEVEPQSVDVFDRLIGGARTQDVAEAYGLTVEAVQKIRQRMRGRMEALVKSQVEAEEQWNDDSGQ